MSSSIRWLYKGKLESCHSSVGVYNHHNQSLGKVLRIISCKSSANDRKPMEMTFSPRSFVAKASLCFLDRGAVRQCHLNRRTCASTIGTYVGKYHASMVSDGGIAFVF